MIASVYGWWSQIVPQVVFLFFFVGTHYYIYLFRTEVFPGIYSNKGSIAKCQNRSQSRHHPSVYQSLILRSTDTFMRSKMFKMYNFVPLGLPQVYSHLSKLYLYVSVCTWSALTLNYKDCIKKFNSRYPREPVHYHIWLNGSTLNHGKYLSISIFFLSKKYQLYSNNV